MPHSPLPSNTKPFDLFRDVGLTSKSMVHRLAHSARNGDEARFLKSWFDKPFVTGAVSPSGRALAETMAAYVNPALAGPVIELGPGTGPVTEALLRRGIAEERLVLIEFNPEFVSLLRQRFPLAQVIEGDAYGLGNTLKGVLKEKAAAVISSLPLFTKPEEQRFGLLADSFAMMHKGSPFIQFTYATVSPMPLKLGGFATGEYAAEVSPRIWLNLPPARVWVYRQPEEQAIQAAE